MDVGGSVCTCIANVKGGGKNGRKYVDAALLVSGTPVYIQAVGEVLGKCKDTVWVGSRRGIRKNTRQQRA